MIVVDCTVIVRLFVREADPVSAEALFVRDPAWAAPSLWQAEFASVLRKYERARDQTPERSSELAKRALLLFQHAIHHVPIARVLETARRTGCSTYDSHYIALAEDLNLKLYTYDEEILKKCWGLAFKP